MYMTSFVDEVEKIALSRLDKEIAAGKVSLQDVPGLPAGATKTQAREAFHAPAPRTIDRLYAKRKMNERMFSQMSRLKPEQLQSIGKPGVHITNRLPGGPMYLHGRVSVPKSSGRFIRTVAESPRLGVTRASIASLGATHPLLTPERMLVPAKGVDPTINRAALQHELGEAGEAARIQAGKSITPVSSHIGVKPILEEQMALRGDPEAIKVFSKVRAREQGDVAVQKAIRQAGGTPDRPLAIGGRQERAVRQIVSRSPQNIGQIGRQKALQMLIGGIPEKQISYPIPSTQVKQIEHLGKWGIEEAQAMAKEPGIRGKLTRLRNVGTAARQAVKPAASVLSWLKKGRV